MLLKENDQLHGVSQDHVFRFFFYDKRLSSKCFIAGVKKLKEKKELSKKLNFKVN